MSSRDNYDARFPLFFFSSSLSVFFLHLFADESHANGIAYLLARDACSQGVLNYREKTRLCNTRGFASSKRPLPIQSLNVSNISSRQTFLFWHLCLREMSSRHPRDRRAKVCAPAAIPVEFRVTTKGYFKFRGFSEREKRFKNITLSC